MSLSSAFVSSPLATSFHSAPLKEARKSPLTCQWRYQREQDWVSSNVDSIDNTVTEEIRRYNVTSYERRYTWADNPYPFGFELPQMVPGTGSSLFCRRDFQQRPDPWRILLDENVSGYFGARAPQWSMCWRGYSLTLGGFDSHHLMRGVYRFTMTVSVNHSLIQPYVNGMDYDVNTGGGPLWTEPYATVPLYVAQVEQPTYLGWGKRNLIMLIRVPGDRESVTFEQIVQLEDWCAHDVGIIGPYYIDPIVTAPVNWTWAWRVRVQAQRILKG